MRPRRPNLRVLAVVATGVALSGAFRFVAVPFLDAREALLERAAAAERALATELADLRDRPLVLATLQQVRADTRRLLHDLPEVPSPGAAEARFVSQAREGAMATGVTLRSLATPGQESPLPGLTLVRILIEGEGALGPLLLFLRELQEGPGLTRLSQLRLEPLVSGPDRRRSVKLHLAADFHALLTVEAEP